MKVRPYGTAAVLLGCASLEEAQGWFAALHDDVETVLGARSVLLRGRPTDLRALVGRTSPSDTSGHEGGGAEIKVPVTYDGADLDHVRTSPG